MPNVPTRSVALATLVLLAISADVRAGGFEHTEADTAALGRSGAWVARADGPMAMRYNPVALARLRGHQILNGGWLSIAPLTYQRAGIDDLLRGPSNPEGPYRTDTVVDVAAPTAAASAAWAWGGERFGLGLGAWAPGGVGRRSFPTHGPQRFALTRMEAGLFEAAVSGAVRLHDVITVGASLVWVAMPWQKLGLVIDATTLPGETEEAGGLHLAHGALDMSDWDTFTAIVGVHLRPAPWIEIGASARVAPVVIHATGDVHLHYLSEGTQALAEQGYVGLAAPDGAPDDRARLRMVLPAWVRGGVRYVHRDCEGDEVFDLELDATWEGWSQLDGYRLSFAGGLEEPFGEPPSELPPVVVPRHLQDTWSLRLGGDVRVWPEHLWLRAGAHYESPATPEAWTTLDFPSFHRLGLAVGARIAVGVVSLDLAYQLVWQPDRVVSEATARMPITRPASEPTPPDGWDSDANGPYSGHAINAGRYTAHFHTLAASLTVALE